MGSCTAQYEMLLGCVKTIVKESHNFWTSPSDEEVEEERREKTLEDEWYIVIKAYKSTAFEILIIFSYYHIHIVCLQYPYI